MSRYTNINVWRRTFDPRPCEECGRNYKPLNKGQKYCSKCKKTAYRKIQKRYLEKKKYRREMYGEE